MAEKKITEPTEHLVDAFRETTQILTESFVAVQEGNMKFVQSTLTSAMEVMQSYIEVTHALMQGWEKQQSAFQKLMPGWGESQWMESYLEMFRAPLSTYQQAFEAAEQTTRQGFKVFEQAVEDVGKATPQSDLAVSGRAKK